MGEPTTPPDLPEELRPKPPQSLPAMFRDSLVWAVRMVLFAAALGLIAWFLR